jgi:hypothetical protein
MKWRVEMLYWVKNRSRIECEGRHVEQEGSEVEIDRL